MAAVTELLKTNLFLRQHVVRYPLLKHTDLGDHQTQPSSASVQQVVMSEVLQVEWLLALDYVHLLLLLQHLGWHVLLHYFPTSLILVQFLVGQFDAECTFACIVFDLVFDFVIEEVPTGGRVVLGGGFLGGFGGGVPFPGLVE